LELATRLVADLRPLIDQRLELLKSEGAVQAVRETIALFQRREVGFHRLTELVGTDGGAGAARAGRDVVRTHTLGS
jgi:hypothetical protein